MKYLLRNLSLVFVVFLWSCTSGDDIVDYSNLAPENTESGPTIGYNEDRNVYFGDLHVHTKHSFDSYILVLQPLPMMHTNMLKVEPLNILWVIRCN
ncbi:MAG: hypothetical protein Ct9H300mP20_20890 [Gammaproteobacteria bacterium]|nr:MAG: hypothetical protein Ct9H300mP20_20890 [Gammaproteobacteria bacterium]